MSPTMILVVTRMISNLEAYNNHKRNTLDRVASKYANYLTDVLESHLKSSQSKIVDALEKNKSDVSINISGLKDKLADVLEDHRKYSVYVGVSDAMREETKDNKLSWSKFNPNLPVELTIVELADVSKRDLISRLINKRITKKAKSIIDQILEKKIESYLKTIQNIYEKASKSYREDETSTMTKKKVTDLIKQVTDVNKSSAERIFRTETTRYFNQSRVDYFTKYSDTDFIQLIAVTDGRISGICESRDLYVIPIKDAQLKKFKPPFHPNCRTIQSPLDTTLKSDEREVRKHLGSEFGSVKSKTSDKQFVGKRAKPNIPLPKGWA